MARAFPDPALALRAFVARKAKSLASVGCGQRYSSRPAFPRLSAPRKVAPGLSLASPAEIAAQSSLVHAPFIESQDRKAGGEIGESEIPKPVKTCGFSFGGDFSAEFRRQLIAAIVAGMFAGFLAAVGAIWAYLQTFIGSFGLVPKDAVVAFVGKCPSQGWDDYTDGIGKFIVGAGAGGKLMTGEARWI
ncbi:MAG: hypothetical protein IPL47_15185 [Phyllobacteriaceae bacterium]|nr:hypothetical protein [Phyllobacteriaceae bacterium]